MSFLGPSGRKCVARKTPRPRRASQTSAVVDNSSTLSLTNEVMGSTLLPMQAAAAPLAAYRGLRGEVLVALKKAQPLTAKELADRFGVTPNALRRHLKELEGDGLVRFSRQTHGVGGPRFAYALTDRGEALFPRAYERALTGALEVVRREHGTAGVAELFAQRWAEVAEQVAPQLATQAPTERVRLLAD